MMSDLDTPSSGSGIDRRSVVRGAAWSLPVIALAIATPAAAASNVDYGAFALNGSCGTLGLQGPGFTLTAASVPLPVGTSVLISGTGVGNIGVFSVSGGTASVVVLSSTARLITLTAALPANATIAFRTTLSITTSFTLNGAVTLPDEGDFGTGSKTTGSVNTTSVICVGT
jgi:hypothetical protein